jgi:hypothetical protein
VAKYLVEEVIRYEVEADSASAAMANYGNGESEVVHNQVDLVDGPEGWSEEEW